MNGAPGEHTTNRRFTRETRLLVVTITVSVIVLLLLARLRFPESSAGVDTSAQPLERLAARASYEELATRIARLEATIAPNLIVLRLTSRAPTAPRRVSDIVGRTGSPPEDVQHVPALRVNETTALAALDPQSTIGGIAGVAAPAGTAAVIALDPVRRLARVRVPEGASRALSQMALSALVTPTYVVAVEGTRAGLNLRPVFLGRADRFTSARWSRPLLPLGGATAIPGALMFTLDGQFLGCVVLEDGALAIAGAADVLEAVERAGSGDTMPRDLGVAVQPLTPALAAATGAIHGVVVSEVDEDGPAAGVLEAGDVVTEVEGRAVGDVDSLLLALGTHAAGEPLRLTMVRNGRREEAALAVAPAPAAARNAPGDLLRLERADAIGARVVGVQAGSPFDLAGLQTGDVILRAGGVVAPTPAQVQGVLDKAALGSHVLLVVRRQQRQQIVAVEISPTDATAR